MRFHEITLQSWKRSFCQNNKGTQMLHHQQAFGQAETKAQKQSLASWKQGTKSRGHSDDFINVSSPNFLLE
jgi:hypothetical protein